MSTNEAKIHEPEVITDDDLRNPGVPATLAEIAALGPKAALDVINSRVEILRTLRIEAIRRTSPEDWVMYKDDKTGREIAYLQDSGCQRVAPLWGIEVTPLGFPERTPATSAKPEDDFAYTYRGDGFCNITMQAIKGIEGTRYSHERYAQQASAGIQREVAVKKAARANLDGTIVRKLSGLNSVPVQELAEAWGSKDLLARCSKGRGYGTQDQRVGGAGTTGISPTDIPICEVCESRGKKGTKLVFRENAKTPFWGCPNFKSHEDKPVIVNDADLRKQIEQRKAAMEQPA